MTQLDDLTSRLRELRSLLAEGQTRTVAYLPEDIDVMLGFPAAYRLLHKPFPDEDGYVELYVGQATCAPNRLRTHLADERKRPLIDKIIVKYCSKDELTAQESAWIQGFKPLHNDQTSNDHEGWGTPYSGRCCERELRAAGYTGSISSTMKPGSVDILPGVRSVLAEFRESHPDAQYIAAADLYESWKALSEERLNSIAFGKRLGAHKVQTKVTKMGGRSVRAYAVDELAALVG